MIEVDQELQERVAALTPAQREKVLDYIRELNGEGPRGMSGEEWLRGTPRISPEFAQELREAIAECRQVPSGVSGRDLLRFSGFWTAEEADEVRRVIEEECERVDPDGW